MRCKVHGAEQMKRRKMHCIAYAMPDATKRHRKQMSCEKWIHSFGEALNVHSIVSTSAAVATTQTEETKAEATLWRSPYMLMHQWMIPLQSFMMQKNSLSASGRMLVCDV